MSQWNFVLHKSHNDRPGNEIRLLRLEAGD